MRALHGHRQGLLSNPGRVSTATHQPEQVPAATQAQSRHRATMGLKAEEKDSLDKTLKDLKLTTDVRAGL